LQAHAFERLAKDVRLERGDVGRDVGKLRHCYQVAANVSVGATIFFYRLTEGSNCR
jgi:hypothetical protein